MCNHSEWNRKTYWCYIYPLPLSRKKSPDEWWWVENGSPKTFATRLLSSSTRYQLISPLSIPHKHQWGPLFASETSLTETQECLKIQGQRNSYMMSFIYFRLHCWRKGSTFASQCLEMVDPNFTLEVLADVDETSLPFSCSRESLLGFMRHVFLYRHIYTADCCSKSSKLLLQRFYCLCLGYRPSLRVRVDGLRNYPEKNHMAPEGEIMNVNETVELIVLWFPATLKIQV